jgi:hypothetical protein
VSGGYLDEAMTIRDSSVATQQGRYNTHCLAELLAEHHRIDEAIDLLRPLTDDDDGYADMERRALQRKHKVESRSDPYSSR